MAHVLPEIVTHTYDPARGAFLNICNLSKAVAETILRGINASGKRTIKANYLERRLATEQWLLSERTRKLGAPVLTRPIYFFLGDFADGLDPSRPNSAHVPLALFAPDMMTFTYSDSMTSYARHAHARGPYHGQVFTLEEIQALVSAFGMPDKTTANYYERFIEAQLWDVAPINELIALKGC